MKVLLIAIILDFLEVVDYGSAEVVKYVKYDDTCPTECSPYLKHGLKPFDFNCTVGNLAEVTNFRDNYMKRKNDVLELFDAPKLVGIDFYHKRFGSGRKEGALSISFQLLEHEGNAVLLESFKENRNPVGGSKYPPAVLLHFQSVDDSKYRDEFYYQNPRERIFRIWNATLGTDIKQIGISYDCFVGLDGSRPVRAYQIALESAFGKNIVYNCTVHVQQGGYEAGYTTEWSPTVATSFNPFKRTLHVVYSEFKRVETNEKLRNIAYSIVLLKGDGTVVRFEKKFNPTDFDILFKGLDTGNYIVKVEKCELNVDGTFGNCISMTSIGTDFTVTKVFDADQANVLKIAVSLSIVANFSLVMGLFLIFFKCLKKKKQYQCQIELSHLERPGSKNNETREALTSNRTDAASNNIHENDEENDCILSDKEIDATHSLDSSATHDKRTHSVGYEFYMNAFIEINASLSTICSSDYRLQETQTEITQNHDNKRASNSSLTSIPEFLTYDDFMEKCIQINASSSSSGGSVSSIEIH